MKAVIQRVIRAFVTVGDGTVGQVERGVAVLVGIHRDDTQDDLEYIARKILCLRLWPSDDGTKTWDRNVKDINGGILLISQFTLMHVLKGNKPDFHLAMHPDKARDMFCSLRDILKKQYLPERVATGEFQSYMNVNIVNDGPVTITLDSHNRQ